MSNPFIKILLQQGATANIHNKFVYKLHSTRDKLPHQYLAKIHYFYIIGKTLVGFLHLFSINFAKRRRTSSKCNMEMATWMSKKEQTEAGFCGISRCPRKGAILLLVRQRGKRCLRHPKNGVSHTGRVGLSHTGIGGLSHTAFEVNGVAEKG